MQQHRTKWDKPAKKLSDAKGNVRINLSQYNKLKTYRKKT